jgi:hypothetical protein
MSEKCTPVFSSSQIICGILSVELMSKLPRIRINKKSYFHSVKLSTINVRTTGSINLRCGLFIKIAIRTFDIIINTNSADIFHPAQPSKLKELS